MSQPPKVQQTTSISFGDASYTVWKKHTMAALAYQIINVNRKTIYTPINMIGMPGFGKTTGTHALVSELKKIDPAYAIHWYEKDDLLKIDKILDELPKHQDCILIFDDVSYLLEDLSREDRKRILHKLTIVREILDPQHKRTRVILMLDFHYSYAIPKAFRQANFAVQFSITDEERDNYLKRIGYSKSKQRKIHQYTQIFESAYKFDNFRVRGPNGEFFEYVTDKPFRPALVFNFSQIHLLLFYPVNDRSTGPNKKIEKPDPNFWADLVRKYGYYRVLKVLRMYVFTQTGKAVIPLSDRKIWNHISDQNRTAKLPVEEIEEILSLVKRLPKTERESQFVKAISAIEPTETEKLEKIKAEIAASDLQQIKEELAEDSTNDETLDLEHSAMRVASEDDEEEEEEDLDLD